MNIDLHNKETKKIISEILHKELLEIESYHYLIRGLHSKSMGAQIDGFSKKDGIMSVKILFSQITNQGIGVWLEHCIYYIELHKIVSVIRDKKLEILTNEVE